MGASIATRMASLAAGARTGLCRHLYDSSASLLWIRRLLALPFCFAAFSSSRFIASRGERVGGWPARLRGTERDLIDRLVGARAVPSEWWRILPAVTSDRSVVLYGYMEASSSMTLPAREGAGVPDGAGRVADSLSPAFESLFRTEYARVVGIAHRVLADQAEAEDVAQDVFVSFYRSHPANVSYAPAWLHAAAAHAALNALRGRDRRSRREAAQAVPLDAAAVSDDPAEVVVASETRDEVRAVLARLPERSAAMLALRYAGLSYAEIAAALDIRASSVGTLLRRAEDAFRRELR